MEYPKYVYHRNGASLRVEDPEEEAKLGPDWADKPFPPGPPPLTKEQLWDSLTEQLSKHPAFAEVSEGEKILEILRGLLEPKPEAHEERKARKK